MIEDIKYQYHVLFQLFALFFDATADGRKSQNFDNIIKASVAGFNSALSPSRPENCREIGVTLQSGKTTIIYTGISRSIINTEAQARVISSLKSPV